MNSSKKVAVLGIGNVRCGPPIVASLATFFGERPLELFFWDSDPERLDLFDRLARTSFRAMKSTHGLVSTGDEREVLAGAHGVVLALDGNCAVKYLSSQGSLIGHGETPATLIRRCAADLLSEAPLEASVLSLIDVEPDGRPWHSECWPPELSEDEQRAIPHQVLRYLSGEDFPHNYLRAQSHTPITEWLAALPSHK